MPAGCEVAVPGGGLAGMIWDLRAIGRWVAPYERGAGGPVLPPWYDSFGGRSQCHRRAPDPGCSLSHR
jgi:hypothetical protein